MAKKKETAAVAEAEPSVLPEKIVRIELPPLRIQSIRVTLIGDSPLICHRWGDKARKMMLDKQMKRAKTAREAKDPAEDFLDSLYWLSPRPKEVTKEALAKARFGFPVVAFKSAAVDACSHVDGVTKVEARGAFHVGGEYAIITGVPEIREDMVRVGMGTADIRYRGMFPKWETTLPIRYNGNVLSAEQIVNLFNTAGFAIGIGEWRPQRDGSYGMFHVAQGETGS